jgi:hypothetical protein
VHLQPVVDLSAKVFAIRDPVAFDQVLEPAEKLVKAFGHLFVLDHDRFGLGGSAYVYYFDHFEADARVGCASLRVPIRVVRKLVFARWSDVGELDVLVVNLLVNDAIDRVAFRVRLAVLLPPVAGVSVEFFGKMAKSDFKLKFGMHNMVTRKKYSVENMDKYF